MEPSHTKLIQSGLKMWNAGYTPPDPVLPTVLPHAKPLLAAEMEQGNGMGGWVGAGQEDKRQTGVRLPRTH